MSKTTGQEPKTSWPVKEWDAAVTKFCPLTRKPCEEKIDPGGGGNPENVRQCEFLGGGDSPEGCRFLHFLDNLTEGPLPNIVGVFLYRQIFGELPPRDHWVTTDGKKRTGPWEWEI